MIADGETSELSLSLCVSLFVCVSLSLPLSLFLSASLSFQVSPFLCERLSLGCEKCEHA